MGPYSELLQAAADIGYRVPDKACSTQHDDALAQAQQVVEHSRQAHELELRLSALSAYLASRTVTDKQVLAARATGLNSAASTLQLISASKDAIADQLRSASLRPSVPVAPEYQQDFANMLCSAASNAAILQDGLQVLQWAASLSDKPSCWEDQLRIIRDSAQAVKDYLPAMQDFDQQLTKSSSAVAPAGACVLPDGPSIEQQPDYVG